MLTFDSSQHRYWWTPEQGRPRELLGVTRTLREQGVIDGTYFSDQACERGRIVHACAETILRGRPLDERLLRPEHLPYVDAVARWQREQEPRLDAVEQRVADPALGSAGTLDVAGSWAAVAALPRGAVPRVGIGDFKTGAPSPWHGVQLAAYAWLRHGPAWVGVARYGIYLTARGTYTQQRYEDMTDLGVYLAAVSLHQWRVRHGVTHGRNG